jgi:hypothetical protein
MTNDEQEGLSHQHYGYWCVPLASGAIAVFSHPNGKLLTIARSWPEVLTTPLPSPPVYRPRKLTMEIGVNLDDLI